MKSDQIIMYTSKDGKTKIDVVLENESLWLSLDQIAELFQRDKSTVSRHLKNIFDEGELERNSVVVNYATTAADGKSYKVDYYNLDAILSVGYRVNSLRGTQFRIWANTVLKEYLIKGFAMNDELLKKAGGGNYWRELLDRIKDIRSSEKIFYRQVLDLYATAVDYNPKSEETIEFFKMVQNKIHYAAHGHTAAEIVFDRANAKSPFMGLTTFSGQQPVKSEVTIAKNYLDESELKMLNQMVSTFFDLAELRAMQRKPMYMADWVAELDKFAIDYGKGKLIGAGNISHQAAVDKAHIEFDKYKALALDQLTPVEIAYLDTLKSTQKLIESKKKKG